MSIFDLSPRVEPLTVQGESLFVRVMTGAQMERWIQDREKYSKEGKLMASLVAQCLCNEHGGVLKQGINEVNELPGDLLYEIFMFCMKVNNLQEEQEDPKGPMAGSSGTGSPSALDGRYESLRTSSTPESMQTG